MQIARSPQNLDNRTIFAKVLISYSFYYSIIIWSIIVCWNGYLIHSIENKFTMTTPTPFLCSLVFEVEFSIFCLCCGHWLKGKSVSRYGSIFNKTTQTFLYMNHLQALFGSKRLMTQSIWGIFNLRVSSWKYQKVLIKDYEIPKQIHKENTWNSVAKLLPVIFQRYVHVQLKMSKV